MEDQGDSVVPGTPKLSQPQSDLFGGITSEQSAQASSSEGGTFGFGSIPDVAVSSSSGGTTTATLAAQDGVDRTAVDIAQFVQATESSSTMGQPRASTSQTKGAFPRREVPILIEFFIYVLDSSCSRFPELATF